MRFINFPKYTYLYWTQVSRQKAYSILVLVAEVTWHSFYDIELNESRDYAIAIVSYFIIVITNLLEKQFEKRFKRTNKHKRRIFY